MDFTLADLNGFTVADLLKISLTYQYKPVGWRSAWVLETIVLKDPIALKNITDSLVKQLDKQKDWSSLRSYTKILMKITDAKQSSTPLSKTNQEIIIENTFNWMIDPQCALAVRCNCMDILYNLSDKYDWVKQELVQQINLFLLNPTPAIASRGNSVLKRILKS